MSRTGTADYGLVPLTSRLRYMQVLRVVAATTVLVGWFALPSARGMSAPALAAWSAGYVVATLPSLVGWRVRKREVSIFGLTLLLDGVFLALVTYATTGFGTPLGFLLLLHVVSVTLLASFRTGLKIAMWHSLLAGTAYQLQLGGFLDNAPPPTQPQLIILVSAVWLVTLATASFAAVNERELRRRNYDLQALARFGLALEATSDPDVIAQALVEALVEEFGIRRIALIGSAVGEPGVLAARGTAPADAALRPAGDALVLHAQSAFNAVRVKRPDPADNPWLAAALPGACNVVAVRLNAESNTLGALIFEHADGGGRIERRVVEMVEQFVSQTALALQNAWLLAHIRALAATDGLTGIANRRTFDIELEREFSRTERGNLSLSVLLLDIDHFKRHNDEYGHQQGDLTLQRVAKTIAEGARGADLAARYGGEEFVVILPNCDLAGATASAERLRAQIAASGEPPVTASIGVATYALHGSSAAAMLRAADEALYESKRAGRDRVTAAAANPHLRFVREPDAS